MPYSSHKGVRTWYEVAGAGPPLLLIHANPLDHRMWLYQTALLSRRFRVVAVDLRAYGRSDKPLHSYGFADVVGDIRAVCDRETLDGAVIGGASMGAKAAFALAADEPGRFAALLLVGGNAFRGGSYDSRINGYRNRGLAYRAEHMAELVVPGFARSVLGRHLMSWLADDSDALSGEAIARLFEAFDGVDLAGRVGALRLPVLIVNGAHDLSLEGARQTAALIAGAEHCVIPDAGHLCCLEDPARFDAEVERFLRGRKLWPAVDQFDFSL